MTTIEHTRKPFRLRLSHIYLVGLLWFLGWGLMINYQAFMIANWVGDNGFTMSKFSGGKLPDGCTYQDDLMLITVEDETRCVSGSVFSVFINRKIKGG